MRSFPYEACKYMLTCIIVTLRRIRQEIAPPYEGASLKATKWQMNKCLRPSSGWLRRSFTVPVGFIVLESVTSVCERILENNIKKRGTPLL